MLPDVVTSLGGAFSSALSDFAAGFSSSAARMSEGNMSDETISKAASRRMERCILESPQISPG
jgi:hypothetical protein